MRNANPNLRSSDGPTLYEPALVSLASCETYTDATLDQAIEQCLRPFGSVAAFVSAGDRVILKPNFLAPEPRERACNTDPALLLALARAVKTAGGTPVIADSPAWGSMAQIVTALGMKDVCEARGIEVLQLGRPVAVSATVGGRDVMYKVSADILEADVVINVPKLKGHRQLGFTGATKNVFGCVPGKRKALWHLRSGNSDARFAERLVEHYALLRPQLNVIDAVTVMEGNGPRLGTLRHLGLLAAATDAVALDVVCAHLLQLPPTHTFLLAAARRLRIGITDLSGIKVVGEPIGGFLLSDFKPALLIGTSFSPLRVARSYLRQFFLTRKK